MVGIILGGANMNRKVKRELSLILIVTFVTILLTGCSDHTNITFQENGSGNYEETFSIDKNLWDTLFEEEGSDETVLSYYRTLYPQAEVTITDETINGIVSKILHLTMDFKNISDYQQIVSQTEILSVIFQPNYFTRSKIYMPLEEESEIVSGIADELEQLVGSNSEQMQTLVSELQNMSVVMTITFPYTVTDTNGSIQEDGKTVVWDHKQLEKIERLYALFHTSNSLSAPTYTGAANGKAYNTGVALQINSENLLDHVEINGETTQSNYLFLSAEGVYNITSVDINGNSSRIKFRIDTTKPSVSGVKNGKTYKKARIIRFADKGSGIKSAILNGQSIQTGKKISKKGTYTLTITDKAGNTKIVTFVIK